MCSFNRCHYSIFMFLATAEEDDAVFGHHFWQQPSDLSKTRVVIEFHQLHCYFIKLDQIQPKHSQTTPMPMEEVPCLRSGGSHRSHAVGRGNGHACGMVCGYFPYYFYCRYLKRQELFVRAGTFNDGWGWLYVTRMNLYNLIFRMVFLLYGIYI